MASKRAAEDETELKSSKRHKVSRTDPTSSQRGAFGDLHNATTAPTGDSDLDCEDDSEALAYLRSVRTQASKIPHILVAKKAGPSLPPQVSSSSGGVEIKEEVGEVKDVDRTIYENGVGDFRGYYQDGAYIAYPETRWNKDEKDRECNDEYDEKGSQDEAQLEDDGDSIASNSVEDGPRNSSADEIRDAYFASITNRYITLRTRLQTDPPNSALAALPATNPTEVDEWKRGVDSFRRWVFYLRGTDPLPAQIAGMHKESVFRLLRILLTSNFLRKNHELHERTSRWLWALLARLPEKGELDYMEVGWIRELGKRAILMMVSLVEHEVLREHYDVGDSSPQNEDGYVVDVDVDDCFDDDEVNRDTPLDVVDSPTAPINEDHTEDSLNPSAPTTSIIAHQTPRSSTNTTLDANNAPLQPHPNTSSDVEMELDSDMEDGEVTEAPFSSPLPSDPITDIEAARAQLLAQLDNDANEDGQVEDDPISTSATPVSQPPSSVQSTSGEGQAQPNIAGVTEEEEQEYDDYEMEEGEEEGEDVDHDRYRELDRAKVNERATLNMILTVAGEFYGQRDLLEFRDPFGGLQFE